MCEFIAVITRIAYLRGVSWWWEQPMSSLFFHMQCWKAVKKFAAIHFLRPPEKTTFAMQSYGTKTKKPTKLLGDWKKLTSLYRKPPRKAAKKKLFKQTGPRMGQTCPEPPHRLSPPICPSRSVS